MEFALKNIGPLLDDKLKAKRRSHNEKACARENKSPAQWQHTR